MTNNTSPFQYRLYRDIPIISGYPDYIGISRLCRDIPIISGYPDYIGISRYNRDLGFPKSRYNRDIPIYSGFMDFRISQIYRDIPIISGSSISKIRSYRDIPIIGGGRDKLSPPRGFLTFVLRGPLESVRGK